MRLVTALFIICLSAGLWISLPQKSTAETRHYPVLMAQSVPEHNSKYDLYGNAEVPETTQVDPQSPDEPASISVTVTAVVLPVRIVTLGEKSLSVSSNTTGQDSFWYAQDEHGKRVALTQDIWDHARQCLASATQETGAKICSTTIS